MVVVQQSSTSRQYPRRSARLMLLASCAGHSSSASSASQDDDMKRPPASESQQLLEASLLPPKAKRPKRKTPSSRKHGTVTRRVETTKRPSRLLPLTTNPEGMARSTPQLDTPVSIASCEATAVDENILQRNDLLPRTRENELKISCYSSASAGVQVMGIDEAGRGPLAGPVVAAAAIIPTDIAGVVDSKKLVKESDRERLYEEIISSPNARWSIAIGDASRIDDVNILQATLECMRNAAVGVMTIPPLRTMREGEDDSSTGLRELEASSKHMGCYVVCGINDEHGKPIDLQDAERVKQLTLIGKHYALIDGNRCPKDMPCEAESMVKGDSKEYAIAAASILAKVTRDRLMHEYDCIYPQYNLKQHKGYPTAAHMACVREFGASPIHRRTFAPLKHMTFDHEGRIIVDKK